MNYGRAIKVARTTRGLSQKALAKRIGVDASFISVLEANKRSPSTETLETISKKLDVPLYLLMLLASEKRDLRGLPLEEATGLARQLLDLLVED